MKRNREFRIANGELEGNRHERILSNSQFAIRNSKSLTLLLLPLLLLSCGALWQTDVQTAVELARTGEYAQAAPVLEAAVAGGNFDRNIVESLYYSWVRQGEYVKARDRFEAWSTANATAGPVRLAAGRVNRIMGNYPRALSHLDPVLNHAQVGVAATFEKAKVLEETGKREDAVAIYDRLIDRYEAGTVREPADLIYIAGALWTTEYFHDANDIFKMAVQANPRNAEAFVAWGDLLAEKYNEPEAVASYEDALAIDSKMPEALLGIARTLALSDPENSQKFFEETIGINPNFIEAHLFLAGQQIDSEQYDNARATIDKVLAINPQSAEAYSLLATIAFVTGKTDEFNTHVQTVLQTNPQYNRLYYILAENCVSLRLYEQAVAFAREALRLNPRDWKSQSLMGMNLLRIGEEEAGKDALEAALEGDRFNVWTANTLTLLDSFVNFDRFETGNFKIKLHKKESGALRPYVVDLLERAHRELSAKYQFVPRGPITFEMFPDHADFAVRTLGLPGLGALGVSFGKVVVMDSPSARPGGAFNWGSTLWHEFMHVITLQMTDHKIPRWFSEGLSVYEERKGFPGWGDDLKPEFLVAIKDKRFLPIAELNDGFIRPKYPQQVLVSYYQASLVADYIDMKWGFPAIRSMLLLYKDGRSTAEVFQQALNVSLEEFDDEFMSWVDARVAGIDMEVFERLISEGQEALAKSDLDKAIESLSKAVAMYPEYSGEHNAYESLADAYLKKGDKPAAIATLKEFVAFDETSFASHVLLSELLEEAGDLAGAAQALEGAMYIRPMEIGGHEKLGRLMLGLRNFSAAAREYETLIALNAPDRAGAYYHLAEANFGEGKRQEARRNVLRALEIAPSYEPAQELLLKVR